MKSKDGRPWTTEMPSYEIPQNMDKAITSETDKLYDKETELQRFLVFLPFRAEPVWPPRKSNSPYDYSYCFCPCCDKPIMKKEAQLVLAFTVVHSKDDTHELFWRPRLVCCKNTDRSPMTSKVESILQVENALRQVFNKAIEKFEPKLYFSHKYCYVCGDKNPCMHPICRYVLEQVPMKQSCDEYFHRILKHFEKIELDVITPLMTTRLCNRMECHKIANLHVTCDICKRVVFCSWKCYTPNHRCLSISKIWKW